MRNWNVLLWISISSILISCQEDDKDIIVQDTSPYIMEYGNLPAPDLPEDNLLTVQGVALGKMLFYEKKLSRDNSISCASCHKQKEGFSDAETFSIGVDNRHGKRQAMPVFNMAWHTNAFFWDGRAGLLRQQSLFPIQDHLEMDETLENVVAKLSKTNLYRDQFTRTFGSEEITPEKISLALEQFMFSIVSYQSKYDLWLEGKAVLTPEEERGRLLFFTEYNPFFPQFSGADCAHCHGGANFENDDYLNNGLDSDEMTIDIGREMVTGKTSDRAKFKVPSLRNIELTAPYMHDGRFSTLEEVVNHYNSGIKKSSTVDPTVLNTKETGLFLTEDDKKDLIAFLKTLTDREFINKTEYADPF